MRLSISMCRFGFRHFSLALDAGHRQSDQDTYFWPVPGQRLKAFSGGESDHRPTGKVEQNDSPRSAA
ncbi:hypothetical protein HGT70_14735 [Rosenbergiella collisarenosi]|uniref:hypothetical protein n=1 Tax=Rosenbergiella collisarenosi TaxID=1544695 RepID=UPI001BDAA1DB|nr:hypothetical protein [Rosenbergiella collisarenosi]MBT0722520.1 hypothetical protein [Rosenbergiella collisarenosi]